VRERIVHQDLTTRLKTGPLLAARIVPFVPTKMWVRLMMTIEAAWRAQM